MFIFHLFFKIIKFYQDQYSYLISDDVLYIQHKIHHFNSNLLNYLILNNYYITYHSQYKNYYGEYVFILILLHVILTIFYIFYIYIIILVNQTVLFLIYINHSCQYHLTYIMCIVFYLITSKYQTNTQYIYMYIENVIDKNINTINIFYHHTSKNKVHQMILNTYNKYSYLYTIFYLYQKSMFYKLDILIFHDFQLTNTSNLNIQYVHNLKLLNQKILNIYNKIFLMLFIIQKKRDYHHKSMLIPTSALNTIGKHDNIILVKSVRFTK